MNTPLEQIDSLVRVETTSIDELQFEAMERTHTVYSHDEIYGQFCPIQIYIDAPPEEVFEYMAQTQNLAEWTYSTRDYEQVDDSDLYCGYDAVGGGNTKIFAKTIANRDALTVDYHCAWDQGDELWMIYLNRIVPAQQVLGQPGSIIFWQNCKHPYYDKNPFPELAPKGRPWVGEMWDFFYAGHTIEFENLKTILEFRNKESHKESSNNSGKEL